MRARPQVLSMDSVSKYFESLSSPRGVDLPRHASSGGPPPQSTEPAAAHPAQDVRAPRSPAEVAVAREKERRAADLEDKIASSLQSILQVARAVTSRHRYHSLSCRSRVR